MSEQIRSLTAEKIEQARAEGRTAFIGYLPAGYPSIEEEKLILKRSWRRYAHINQVPKNWLPISMMNRLHRRRFVKNWAIPGSVCRALGYFRENTEKLGTGAARAARSRPLAAANSGTPPGSFV